MSWEFRPGMKVVCIKRGEWLGPFGEMRLENEYPVYRGIYTIRDVSICSADGEVYLRFEELRNPQVEPDFDGEIEARFWAAQFRPLVERKTDISVFRAMLTPKRVEEPA